MAGLKLDIDKLIIDKLKAFPVDLRELSNAVDNDFVKKTVCGELVTKVNIIETNELKTQYNTDKIEKTRLDWSWNTCSITGLATAGVLNAAESKIHNISNSVNIVISK